ncbi:hypothetical protein MNBD_GAMMA06-1910 [hydrothermal vent metagenome]|uniref:Response regulatory domain-containing protein n=1 Tax=hydrothermal vent metagenome TaxID=652676 RepID=A0A3B0X6Z8_9ZZZZ
MTPKRALIVDDSKSARFALMRMLKELNLEVDTAESALDALKYLEQHQPNIIFMDHIMPGMDGFEAIKKIKENPQTALIPIMMYTSKGGDVYMSQARALGAVGIIRKTIAPVELKESLLELRLIDDIPIKSSITIDKPATPKKKEDPLAQEITIIKKNALDLYVQDLHKLMDDQTIELHRSMWLGIESVSNEIFNRLNSDLDKKIENVQHTLQENAIEQTNIYKSRSFWSMAGLSLLLLISFSYNIAQYFTDKPSIAAKPNSDTSSQPEDDTNWQQYISAQQSSDTQVQNLASNNQSALTTDKFAQTIFKKWVINNDVIEYAFDEIALNDRRLPFIEELVNKAQQANYRGRIILQTHVGEFCLNSDLSGNYTLADEDTSIYNCDFIGNYAQPTDEPIRHQSLSFVNYFSDAEKLSRQGIFLEVQNLSRKISLAKYPKRTSQTNAGTWNQAARFNNRITVKLIPETQSTK